jgi:hypothetical protein
VAGPLFFAPLTTTGRVAWAPTLPRRSGYACAREMQRDHLLDEIVHIAGTDPNPKRARVRINARKWLFEKMAPKKYERE